MLVAGRALVCANPQGMHVVRGHASASASGSQLDITASRNAVINWQTFNIAAGETTTFIQPSSRAVVWNQIFDQNPSQIWGSLNANGYVVLMNRNGFYFGPNSSVSAGGFMALSASFTPPADMGGGFWNYQGPPPTASIINYGSIQAHTGGSLFLIADSIDNEGSLSAPSGKIGLYAGKQVLISDRPDGRGVSASVELPEGSINNSGQIIADAGTIALHAQVVNQNGLIQANSVRNRKGVVELVATDAIHLGAGSLLQANGGDKGQSAGGKITVNGGQTFTDDPGSRVQVRGGLEGGDGGSIEISATELEGINSQLDAVALAGWNAGTLLLDPYDIRLGTSSSFLKLPNGAYPGGTVAYDGPPTATGAPLQINVANSFKGFSQITLQAAHDITLMQGTTWDLDGYTGVSAPGSKLTLEAGHNILFQNNTKILAGPGWSVSLSAGVDFSSPALATIPGVGGIYLGGLSSQGTPQTLNGSIETQEGDITMVAGHEVRLGGGFVRTVNGGNISITTGDGNVNSGTANAASYGYGFSFNYSSDNPYAANPSALGGIGTGNGGDVTINAGVSPTLNPDGTTHFGSIVSPTATIGAFGQSPGNVTLIASGSVSGNFTVRNGTGTIMAGETVQNPTGPNPSVTQVLNPNANVGTVGSGVSLGIAGGGANVPGWNVFAANTIYVNEVYNPNGVLNSAGGSAQYLFDYAPGAYAKLFGGYSVQLVGGSLVGPSGVQAARNNPIYAPILDITAGAGGVVLGSDVVLYPSVLGSLDIRTSAGGSLSTSLAGDGQPAAYRIVLSDSGLNNGNTPGVGFSTFINDHALVPVHKSNVADGVQLDISGDVDNVLLVSPEAAQVHIHGNAKNFYFEGQNLSANDTTMVHIDGDYFTRSPFTSVAISGKPNLSVFTDPVLSTDPELGALLGYDPKSQMLTFQGYMTAQFDTKGVLIGGQLYELLHPQTYVLDPSTGKRQVDSQNNPILARATFSSDTTAILNLYAQTQDIPFQSYASTGLQINGPGHFDVSARNMNLDFSAGIQSLGPQKNLALAALSLTGADIRLDLAGDLEMTGSEIASFNGGGIDIESAGKIDVGTQQSAGASDTPRGIYTGHGGDVTVHAVGDVNVNGSRIASYNGGDVTVISDNGNVDAGSGGSGFFYVPANEIDPVTHEVTQVSDKFFGSGILALTASTGDATVGDITVQAGKDILAGASGILQLALNHYRPVNVAGLLPGVMSDLLTTGKFKNPVPNQGSTKAKVTLTSQHGSILADNSGVLGQNLEASAPEGDIKGIFAAVADVNIHAQNSVSVTVVAGGTANVTGQSVAGSIAASGDVTVSGSQISASVISTGGTATSGGSSVAGNAFSGVAAPQTAQQTVESADKTVASQSLTSSDDDDTKRRAAGKGPAIKHSIGRVTVILPKT